jgi:hypothetical protein
MGGAAPQSGVREKYCHGRTRRRWSFLQEIPHPIRRIGQMTEALARRSLADVVSHLGSALLTTESSAAMSRRTIAAITFYDAAAPTSTPPEALVLGVGIVDQDHLADLVRRLADQGASALIVAHQVSPSSAVRTLSERLELPIFVLPPGVSPGRIFSLLDGLVSLETVPTADPVAGDETTDLFLLADTLADALDAPISIVDLAKNVVAFSANQAATDDIRQATILGRRAPESFHEANVREGNFRAVYGSDRPVFIPRLEPGRLSRMVMRVRAGDELLGSIWAVVRERLTPQSEEAMVEASYKIAKAMQRSRLSSDATRRHRFELVSMLLDGGDRARDAAHQLDFRARPVCLVALGTHDELTGTVLVQTDVHRVASRLSAYFQAFHPRAVCAVFGHTIYAIVPVQARPHAEGEADRIINSFLEQGAFATVVAGVGRVVTDPADIPKSRIDADAALRVLRSSIPGVPADRRVMSLTEVRLESLLLRIGDILVEEEAPVSPPLAALRSADRDHGTAYLETVRTWLERFGDITSSAADFHIHPNTFRYRIARACEIARIDLDDPRTRFGLMLELRLPLE